MEVTAAVVSVAISDGESAPPPEVLKHPPVAALTNLGVSVPDRRAAIVLPKVLSWEMQAKRDGGGFCNVRASSDRPRTDTLAPVLLRVTSGHYSHLDKEIEHRAMGRALVLLSLPDCMHQRGGVNAWRVASRSTPTMIDVLFNLLNLWDDRAEDIFDEDSPLDTCETDSLKADAEPNLISLAAVRDETPFNVTCTNACPDENHKDQNSIPLQI